MSDLPTHTLDRQQRRANKRIAFVFAGVAVGMVGMAYAAVPLYRVFCQVTGFGGVTQRADTVSGKVLERAMTVRFDSNTSPALAWRFKPVQHKLTVKIGEPALAYFSAENLSRETVTGTATFNVSPPQAGGYFVKTECFCFTEQTLKPGEKVDMPVTFYVDPDIAEDADLRSLKTITLSYTFYPARKQTGNRSAEARLKQE